jgi:hypothetical protein
LFTNVTRCPTAMVISSGCMPDAVIETVGEPDGDGVVDGVLVGVGVVGADVAGLPEQPAAAVTTTARRKGARSMASL